MREKKVNVEFMVQTNNEINNHFSYSAVLRTGSLIKYAKQDIYW